MRLLGPVTRLQIQTASLKRGEKPHQWYDPAALSVASEMRLDRRGAWLEGPGGDVILDVHHLDHPQSKQTPGENPLSLEFSHHYEFMRGRFGAVVADGVAGENLIVGNGGLVELEHLQAGVVIRSRTTGRLLALRNLSVAHPCRPFSLFALGGSAEPEALKEALRFLDGGMRGFYMVAEGGDGFTVRLGDEVFAA
ncbi:MAG TPA: hypothetical protein VFF76_08990 [Holophagaceae bacterium]|jgi:hypothetical protein|nr:hypothetical protein [Holophagaceae bacterium]